MQQAHAQAGGSTSLANLLLTPAPGPVAAPAPKPAQKQNPLVWIDVNMINAEPAKITKAFAASIVQYGVITPVLVQSVGGGWYDIVAGRRRLAAAIAANQPTIPAMVTDRYDQGTNTQAHTIIENVFRTRNLSSELRAMRILSTEGRTADEMQAMLGLPKRDFMRYSKLLGLQRGWIDVLDAGLMSPTTAAIIAGLSKDNQDELLATVEKEQRVTLDAARAFRLKKQYDTKQLSFLSTALPAIEAPKW